MINICGCVRIPGAKQGMLELIPQTLFFLERARVNTDGGSGYPRLCPGGVCYRVKVSLKLLQRTEKFVYELAQRRYRWPLFLYFLEACAFVGSAPA